MENSKQLRLNGNDFYKGLIMAVLTALLTSLAQVMDAENFTFEILADPQTWIVSAKFAIGAASAYLIKQLTTNSSGEVLKKEVKK